MEPARTSSTRRRCGRACVEVLLRPCALFFFHKDDRKATEMVDAFEASLVKFVVASAEWR